MNSKEIGEIIKRRRLALKVNQLTLSELEGIGINTLVTIERGTGNPTLDKLLSVLDTLGLQMDVKLKD